MSGRVYVQRPCEGTDCPDQKSVAWHRTGPVIELVVPLENEGSTRIVAEGRDCWAAPLILDAKAAGTTTSMQLWPAGTVVAALDVPEGLALPKRVAIRIESTPKSKPKVDETLIDCPISNGKIRCVMPASTVDLRVAAESFAPIYEWGRSLGRGATLDLGRLQLRPGGSVSGYVVYPVKGADAATISVEIAPAAFAGTSAALRDAAMRRQTKANARGFYQFRDLAPGAYTVMAVRAGWSTVSVDDIRVDGSKESVVKTLTLEALAHLDGTVEPALGPDGKPWSIELARVDSRTPTPSPTRTIPVSAAGYWLADKLERGGYALELHDSRGAMLHRQFATARDGDPPIQIKLTHTAVRGKVTYDGDPIAGDVRFRAVYGESVNLRAGDDGEFSGILPHPGKWMTEVTPKNTRTLIHLHDVDIRRNDNGSSVRVDLELPPGRFRGKTVDEDAKPVVAGVYVWRDNHIIASATTSADGAFDLIGLEKGDAQIRAEGADGDTGRQPGVIGGVDDPPKTIVVPKKTALKGWVVTPDGRPVAGTVLRCYPELVGWREEKITGPSGEFSLSVPAGQTSVNLSVVAPGFPVKLAHLEAGEPQEIVVGRGSGTLLVEMAGAPPWPMIRFSTGASVPLSDLLPPIGSPRPQLTERGLVLQVEPGVYTLCGDARLERCATAVVSMGGHETIDAKAFYR